jgi:hypothetical protein
MNTATKAGAKEKAARRGEERDPAAGADWYWADPKSLQVNPAFQGLIPLQSKGEYRALERSILAEGCRDPLLVWKGRNIVLDGHTRRDLCMGHEKRVKVREVELPDEKAAIEFILQIQNQRRNLTREARSYFRGAEYNRIKQARGGRRESRKTKGLFDPQPSTAQRLAVKHGVSEKTIKRDAFFARVIDKIAVEHGDPEVKRKLLGADVKLTHGTAKGLLQLPAAERKAAVDRILEWGGPPWAQTGTGSKRRPKEVAQVLVARLQTKGEGHARSVLQQMARLLGMEVVEKSPDT